MLLGAFDLLYIYTGLNDFADFLCYLHCGSLDVYASYPYPRDSLQP